MKNDGMDCHVALWALRNDGGQKKRHCEHGVRGNPYLQ